MLRQFKKYKPEISAFSTYQCLTHFGQYPTTTVFCTKLFWLMNRVLQRVCFRLPVTVAAGLLSELRVNEDPVSCWKYKKGWVI